MCQCEEQWKEIEGYPNYKISSKGNVYSKYKNCNRKHGFTTKGYHQCCLYKNGKQKNIIISNYVGKHFILNPKRKKQIDHIDGDLNNNCICNLRWATNGENQRNQVLDKSNTSGHKNITWDKKRKKWKFQLCIDKVTTNFGAYESKEMAVDLRDWYYENILKRECLEYR